MDTLLELLIRCPIPCLLRRETGSITTLHSAKIMVVKMKQKSQEL